MKTGTAICVLVACLALGFGPVSQLRAATGTPWPRVVIYYDDSSSSDKPNQRFVNMLHEMLGHFAVQVDAFLVTQYTSGHLNSYDAAFYIGYHEATNALPAAFKSDLAQTAKPVVWLHHNIEAFLNVATNRGMSFVKEISAGYDRVLYKGQALFTTFDSSNPFHSISVTSTAVVRAYAFSQSQPTLTNLPYVIQSSNFWYFADNPFRTERQGADSLVLADLLHEILRAVTLNVPQRALVRIEDVSPDSSHIGDAMPVCAAIQQLGVTPTCAIIPRYVKPTNSLDVIMSTNRAFLSGLKTIARSNASFITHGYTHQWTNEESGTGYEFWDDVHSGLIPGDSWAWATGRVERARTTMADGGVLPRIWETPHYAASLLDSCVFGELYASSFERMNYFAPFVGGLTHAQIEAASATNTSRDALVLPYAVEGIYGNTVIPENADYIDLAGTDSNGLVKNVSNKVVYAQKIMVVRDAVVGFYYHAYLLTPMATNIVGLFQGLGLVFTTPEQLADELPVPCMINAAYALGSPWLVGSGAVTADTIEIGGTNGHESADLANCSVSNRVLIIGSGANAASNTLLVRSNAAWRTKRSLWVGKGAGVNALVLSNATLSVREVLTGVGSNAPSNDIRVYGVGARWTTDYGVRIGQVSCFNTVEVDSGAHGSSQFIEIGVEPGASSNRVVLAGGSVWSNAEWLAVGRSGASNSLAVQAGATLSSSHGFVGLNVRADGNAAAVTGPGARWTVSRGLVVGSDSSANALRVDGGGAVACASLTLGDFDRASRNQAIVSDDGIIAIAGDLTVGGAGNTNSLVVAEGGSLQSSNTFIGRYLGSANSILINGTRAAWSNAGCITLSGAGGSITVTNGGTVHTHQLAGTGQITVGPQSVFLYEDATGWSGTVSKAAGGFFARDTHLAGAHGTPEWWLLAYGLTNGTLDARETQDSDLDGAKDWEEFVAGTDPKNGQSILRCLPPQAPDPTGGLVLRWPSTPNKTYSVLRASSLHDSLLPIQTNCLATPAVNSWTDQTISVNGFYRIRVDSTP